MLRLFSFVAIFLIAHAAIADPATTSTQPSGGDGWTVLFRADDPTIWGKATGDASSQERFAVAADKFPSEAKYLRLKRVDTGDAVIMAMGTARLDSATGDFAGDLLWRPAGESHIRKKQQATLMGIARRSWPASRKKDPILVMEPHNSGRLGWGFAIEGAMDFSQRYSWNGHAIDKTTFEVAVRNSELSNAERNQLLVDTPVTPPADEDGWTILFRSSNPGIWRKTSSDYMAHGFALTEELFPHKVRFIRFTRMDTGDFVIMAAGRATLTTSDNVYNGDLIWKASGEGLQKDGRSCVLLGIGRKSWGTSSTGEHVVWQDEHAGLRGWGFSKAVGEDFSQTYSWAGRPIAKNMFEIAVRDSDLNADDQLHLLSKEAESIPAPNPDEPVKIARRQSSIHGLTVQFDNTGAMMGNTVEVILTAYPGPARTDAPVKFVTPVGNEMTMVLDDVLRSIRLKYGKWEVDHVDLTFDDRVSKMNGGSIGAALGTLVLSMLEGYEIDPKLAITGDVIADGRVRPIGGVIAKLHGASNAGCTIVAVPTDNYDQLVDGLVYEGPGLFTKMQVIGIANLDQASHVARTDRDEKLRHAIEMFGQVQDALKKSADAIKGKAVRENLTSIVDLAPNHYSAKLLLLASQEKQPRRLSATASLYYTAIAIRGVMPAIDGKNKATKIQDVAPAAIVESLKCIDRVKRVADPTVVPLVDAWREFIRALGDVRTGVGSVQTLQMRASTLEDAAVKLNARRDVMEKMLREGV